MANKKLPMKLLINSKSQTVLFAEVGKDVVDFLFSLLGLPLGSVIKLLTKDRMVGSITNLYQSLEGFDNNYLQPNYNKSDLLNPSVFSPALSQSTLLLEFMPTAAKSYYRCSCGTNRGYNTSTYTYVTDGYATKCPSCQNQMTTKVTYVKPIDGGNQVASSQWGEGGGMVKGLVTYTIMDDLTVSPMSTISSITLLSKLHVKDMSVLKEQSVELGFDEGLELLKESLQSKTVLTNVFLGKNV